MRVLSFVRNGEVHLGLKTDGGVIDVTLEAKKGNRPGPALPQTMEELISQGKAGLDSLRKLETAAGHAGSGGQSTLELLDESTLEYAPVVARPDKILCIGLNYLSHIEEIKVRKDLPKYPEVFAKTSNALAAHKQPFKMPETAHNYDYEAELVLVIGKECSEVPEEKALDYVFGYTCGNDITSRELQKRGLQWFMGKSLDDSAPVGPHIVTADCVDPSNLNIVMKRGDEVVQSSNTSKLLFNCAHLVSYISQYMILKPGDLIMTGTPSGVIGGMPAEKQRWLEPGETLTVSIEGIGDLVNTTIARPSR